MILDLKFQGKILDPFPCGSTLGGVFIVIAQILCVLNCTP